MDITQLRYFKTIAQSGSMTSAAQILRVSQPTLTVSMRNLEERLSTTLFLRDRSGITLTATGQELLNYAGEIFALLDKAEQHITGMEDNTAGRFVVGCHESLGSYFLPGFMSMFMHDFPQIEISLWNGLSQNVMNAVIQREVHFGLVVNALPHPELVLVKLFRDDIDIFVLRQALVKDEKRSGRNTSTDILEIEPNFEANNDPLHPKPWIKYHVDTFESACECIRRATLIYTAKSQAEELIGRLSADGILPNRMLSCGDLELVKSLTLSGLGLGILPSRVAAYGQEGKLQRLHQDLPNIHDSIYLIYRADFHRTKAALKLKDSLVTYGRKLENITI